MKRTGLMKKAISLLSITALLFASGCGAKQTEPEGGVQDSTNAAAQEEQGGASLENAEQEAGTQDITIHFSEHVANIEAQEPHMMKIIQAFEETYPNIHVEITGKEVSEHNTQMTLLAGENNLPDIFWLEQAPAKEFAQNGYLYDLTGALNDYGINDSLLPGLVNSCTVDGKDYGIPSEVMMVGFFYNKELFEQAGIETAPVTYEEFTDAVFSRLASSPGS